MSAKKVAGLSVLAALSIVIVSIFHIPIFPAVPFLEFDFADIPIFLATFMYGPAAGLALTLVVSVLQGVTVSAASGIFGIIMHFAATGSYVLTAGLIYKYRRTLKGALVSMLCGIVVWLVVMTAFNLVITPLFVKMSVKDVVPLLPYIAAFNAIKSVANSAVTFALYKSMHRLFKTYFDATPKRKKRDKKGLPKAENDIPPSGDLKESEIYRNDQDDAPCGNDETDAQNQ